jgi:hypothetical protein
VQTAQAGAQAAGRDLVVIDGTTYQRNADGSFTPAAGLPSGTPTRPGTPARTTGTGAPKTNTLEANRVKNERLGQAYQTDPVNKEYIKKISEGKYDFRERPVLGATNPNTTNMLGFGGTKYTQDDLDNYDNFRKEIDPNYVPPKTSGIGPAGTTKTAPEGASAKPGLGPTSTPAARTTTPPATTTPRAGAVVSAEDKTRADIRAKIANANQNKGPQRQAELEGMLANPNTPNQLRPVIQRELDEVKRSNTAANTKTYTDSNNPMNKRRTSDGGKTFEYSHDGGQTWGKR